MEGFDLINVLPPASRRQATLIRVAFDLFKSPHFLSINKKNHPEGWFFLLAE